MSRNITHILSVLLVLLCSTGLYAQVHIGDGLTISEGTSLTISNQDVVIATDEIKGEGSLVITNDKEQKITLTQKVRSNTSIEVKAENIQVIGEKTQYFALEHLPPLTEKIIAKVQERKIEEDLPVRYINAEGLTFGDENEPQELEAQFTSLPNDVSGGIMVSEVLQWQAAEFTTDYILPIYSFTFNDVRFSDYAELYEFQSLTAILKPPIV